MRPSQRVHFGKLDFRGELTVFYRNYLNI